MKNPIELKVGEKAKLRSLFLGSYRLIYAGMPNDQTFGLVITYEQGYTGMAYNLFYPKKQSRIELQGNIMEILAVSPNQIQIRFLDGKT